MREPQTTEEIEVWIESARHSLDVSTAQSSLVISCLSVEAFKEFSERYSSFEWSDFDSYWQCQDGLAERLTDDGYDIFLAPLADIEEYEAWCDLEELEADDSITRAEWAESHKAMPYQGSLEYSILSYQLEDLFQDMIDDLAESEKLDPEELFSFIGGKAAHFLLEEIKPHIQEHSHLTITSEASGLGGAWRFSFDDDSPIDALSTDNQEMAALYALSISLLVGAGVTLRSMSFDHELEPVNAEVRGWFLSDGHALRLSSAEVFNAYCTTPDGDIIPPEPGLNYVGGDEAELVDLD